MQLLPRQQLIKTGPVDFADWNYRPLLGQIQRLRFRLACKLLKGNTQSLLEIGYGSGVFLPELARFARELYGIDIHSRAGEIMDSLSKLQVKATLVQAAAEAMPYPDAQFDQVVAVSSLEFVTDLDVVCQQVKRVLKPDGLFVVITPGHSKLADFGLRLLTGRRAKDDFDHRRLLVVETLLRHFDVERKLVFPPVLHQILILYRALSLRRSNLIR